MPLKDRIFLLFGKGMQYLFLTLDKHFVMAMPPDIQPPHREWRFVDA